MANLIYSTISSLDGYVADETGNFDWAEPDGEVHAFINDLQRGIGTYLYGRRLYEVMSVWETMNAAGEPSQIQDFAEVWRSADKIVFSKTLGTTSTDRTRLERTFDPEAVRELKSSAQHDLAIGGPDLAASAFRAQLVDECQLFLAPVVVGGGTRSLPDSVHMTLDLMHQRTFKSGFVFLRYRTRDGAKRR